jgi:phosphate-selective porin OprO/OprP
MRHMRTPGTAVIAMLLALAGSARGEEAAPAPSPVASASPAPDAAAQDPATTPPAEPGSDYRPWKTLYRSATGSIRILSRGQFRWTDDMPDDRVRLPGTPNPGDSKGSFRVRRAKTELKGFVWNENITYDLQLSWAGPEPGASTQTPLEDFLVTWDASKKKTFQLTFGQFKVPFGRQEFTSSGQQQFADRDILSGEFTRGRDLGVQVEGVLGKGHFTYMAGVFNGNPASRLGNDNDKYQFDARVMWEPFGAVGYDEADFQSTDHPLVAIAAEWESNDQHGSTDSLNDFKTRILGADVMFKYKGFSTFAEYFARHRDPETGDSFSSNGWHAQAGYFLVRNRLEVALRRAQWDPSELVGGDDQKETGAAVNYYVHRHALKVTGDFRRLDDDARGTTNDELRIQAQIMF